MISLSKNVDVCEMQGCRIHFILFSCLKENNVINIKSISLKIKDFFSILH